MLSSKSSRDLVQLAGSSHSSQRFDALVHRHLRTIPVLQLQLLVLVAALGDVVVDPVEGIRHVVILLGHARSVTDRVRDYSAVRLYEIDLGRHRH